MQSTTYEHMIVDGDDLIIERYGAKGWRVVGVIGSLFPRVILERVR